MTEEEKKAIEILKGISTDDLLNYWEGPEEPYNAIQVALNLIQQQDKIIKNQSYTNKKMKKKLDNYRKLTKLKERKIGKQDIEINKLNNVIDRMQWRPIKEYNRKDYDWVLVKYFDGDYECVPEVAEQRIDGKWYTTERELPFEVKYFFDMQILDEESRREYE